ncbi:unnamed protein product [Closterium sp. Yama58-4]|nr:unnamed protein product [Closterium sp. Yama58-4]
MTYMKLQWLTMACDLDVRLRLRLPVAAPSVATKMVLAKSLQAKPWVGRQSCAGECYAKRKQALHQEQATSCRMAGAAAAGGIPAVHGGGRIDLRAPEPAAALQHTSRSKVHSRAPRVAAAAAAAAETASGGSGSGIGGNGAPKHAADVEHGTNVDMLMPELLPDNALRLAGEICSRMVAAGGGSQLVETYRKVRSNFLKQAVESLNSHLVNGVVAAALDSMGWSDLEVTSKQWAQHIPRWGGATGALGATATQGGAPASPRWGAAAALGATAAFSATAAALVSPRVRGAVRALTRRASDASVLANSDAPGGGSSAAPAGGGVDPITSYVCNFIRSFLSPLGRRNYAATLATAYSNTAGERGGEGVYEGMLGGGSERVSVELLVGVLVVSLREYVDKKAAFIEDAAMRELYQMNNLHYLMQSMNSWGGWRQGGLQQAFADAKGNGRLDLALALSTFIDGSILQKHVAAFQTCALSKVIAAMSDRPRPLDFVPECTKPASSLWPFSHSDGGDHEVLAMSELLRLRAFNRAMEELVEAQKRWAIPDAALRLRVCTAWAACLKDRYRKLLQPRWDDLITSKHYMHTPESLELMIMEDFFN